MARQEYLIVANDDDVRGRFTADLCQASAPIFLDGVGTPFRTAGARHNAYDAAGLLVEWCDAQGGPIVDDGEAWGWEET